MGYTHYWDFKKKPADIENGKEKFKKAVAMFKSAYKHFNIPIANGMGKGEPVITDNTLCFNGIGKDGYESCYFALDDQGEFCKTNKQAYDTVVCFAIRCFKEAFGDDFSFRSDGYLSKDEGWIKSKRLMDKIKNGQPINLD